MNTGIAWKDSVKFRFPQKENLEQLNDGEHRIFRLHVCRKVMERFSGTKFR